MEEWTAIVPIRSIAQGKSRLHGHRDTPTLVQAFARDVLAACTSCPQIHDTIVVSADPHVLQLAAEQDCRAFTEAEPHGINEAIAQVRRTLSQHTATIAILGDTPCLNAQVLSTVIAAAEPYRDSFVADTAGTGTTIWCTRSDAAQPHFGHHSRAHHRAAGAHELGAGWRTGLWSKARRDVDTEIDLWDAQRLGVGPATQSALNAH